MKHITTSILTFVVMTLFVTFGFSQATQQALVIKKTGTWCSNCGSWGWTWFKDIMEATKEDNVIPLSLHSTSSTLKPENDLDGAWLSQFSINGGFPTFYVNGNHHSTYASLLSGAKAAAIEEPVTGIDVLTGFDQDTLYAQGSVTFLNDGNGEYSLGFYLVEDSVIAQQAAQGPNTIHRNVIRLALGDASFGEAQMVTHTDGHVVHWSSQHHHPLADTEQMYILAVLWKKVQNKQTIVNANMVALEEGVISSTEALPAMAALTIFPNPVRKGQEITVTGVEGWSIPPIYSLYTLDGVLIPLEYNKHSSIIPIPESLRTGNYLLTVLSGDQKEVRVITIID